MDLLKTYFYTATILNWIPILSSGSMKKIVTQSLEFLSATKKIRVYGFVIMPNHIHLVLKSIGMNGKEFPEQSLLKFTAHEFKKELSSRKVLLDNFMVRKADRKYQFWQRNSLPLEVTSKTMLKRVLNYTHSNPLQQHWNLVYDPNLYEYSSSSFYNLGEKRYPWLVDYRDDF